MEVKCENALELSSNIDDIDDKVDDDILIEDAHNISPTEDEPDDAEPPPTEPQFQYHLFVHLKGGHNLPGKKQNGSSDPYAKFLMNGKTVHRSKTVHKELNPSWDESFMVSVPNLAANMEIKIFNHNLVKDDIIGSYSLDLVSLSKNKSLDIKVALEESGTGPHENAGEISVGLNLVCVPLERGGVALAPAYQAFPTTTTNNNNNKPRKTTSPAVLSLALVMGRDLTSCHELYCKFRLGAESCKSRAVSNCQTPRWCEQFDLLIPDLDNIHNLEVKLKDLKSRDILVGRCSMNLNTLEKEKSHEVWLDLEDNQGSLFLIVAVTGTIPSCRSNRVATPEPPVDNLGSLGVTVIGAQGLAAAKLGGYSDTFCVVELDNCRLRTQVEHRSLAPAWGKTFQLPVLDIHSALHISVYDMDRNNKTELLGKLCIPLLNMESNIPIWFALKDKRLRNRAKGNCPRIELQFDLKWNFLKAAFQTVNPKNEVYLRKSEKFKRRLLNNNVTRIKSIISDIKSSAMALHAGIHWESRSWTSGAFLVFIIITYFLELYMLPLAFCLVFLQKYAGTLRNESFKDDEEKDLAAFDNKEEIDMDREDNICFAKIMQMIQDAFPLVQNYLGLLASAIEKLKNTLNWTVPFLSLLAVLVLLVVSVILFFIPIRYIVMIIGSVKFIKNLIWPGYVTNNEILDFMSRVPDDEILEDYRELSVDEEKTDVLAEKAKKL